MSRKRYGYGQFMLDAMDRAEHAGQEPTTAERWERMYRQEEALRRNIDREREQLQQENARLREALESIICRVCENRIGWRGERTIYGDWRTCEACRAVRAALEPTS